MNFTLLSSIMTIISLVVFLGILYWAFSARNKTRFEEIGRLDNDPDLDAPQNMKIHNKDGQ